METLAATNDIFQIAAITITDGEISAVLNINKDSLIFNGHFPGQPVVPGACMLQIVKEVLETTVKMPLRLQKAGQLKFLNAINPEYHSSVQLNMSYKQVTAGEVETKAQIVAREVICFKFYGVFARL